MQKLIEFIIQKLKGNPEYRFQSDYSFTQLYYISYYRLKQILRGLAIRVKFKKVQGILFSGKKVSIEHGYLITTGRSLILEDGVSLLALSQNGISFGNNVTIARNAVLNATGVIRSKGTGITIGNNSAVGAQSYLGGQGGITIGNDVIMGPGVKIFSENHNYSDPDIPIRMQGENRTGVTIGDNCWIGSGVIILDGVTLESGTIVAAGAVVSKSFGKNQLIGGVPARIIKENRMIK